MKGILEEKSFQFAIRIVDLYRFLIDTKKDFVLSKQMLRAGTSIGANVAEAQFAQSKADFVSKMHISLKEANETRYWLRLLEASNLIDNTLLISIMTDCNELINMLVSTCKTSKE